MHIAPAVANSALHAKGKHHLGVAAAFFDKTALGPINRHGARNRIFRDQLVQIGGNRHHHGTAQGQVPKPRVNKEHDHQKERNPWHIKDTQNRRAAQKTAHNIQITNRVVAAAVLRGPQLHPVIKRLVADQRIKPVARA